VSADYVFQVALTWAPTVEDRRALLPRLNALHGFDAGRIPFDVEPTSAHDEATHTLMASHVNGAVRLYASVALLPDGTFELRQVHGWVPA
jgi:hypothetical protein